MSTDRELDVVVYGATGFVGKLTAEYLAHHAPGDVRIGLAGRSADRLEAVKRELGVDWPVLVADAADPASLERLAGSCRVVATTVGPYKEHGLGLVEACARGGTDYADLTGEVLFMHETVSRFDAVARGSGARIVHTCGFDSIPSDLGVLLLHEAVAADGAGELEEATLVVKVAKGGASGGTIASAKGQIDDLRADGALKRVVDDPYSLSPDRANEPDLGKQPDVFGPFEDESLGGWMAPFVMAGVNTRVVRRSNALQGWAYGKRLRYREVMRMGTGVAGRAKALGVVGGLGAAMAGLGFGPTRAVLDRVLPSPGEGPGEDIRRNGFFRIDVHGRTSTGARYVCHVAAQGDPGYAATAVMLGESALCLSRDRDRLPDRAGVLTPATAMGDALVDRLRAAGHTYDVERL
jgi:short subunit dehydrogenase-like uncharacterized protein